MQASKDCKKFYPSYNLMETTTRTNLTSLTLLKLESREVKTLAQFQGLVEELYCELCDFEKFEAVSVEKEIVEEVVKEEVDKVVRDLLEEATAMEDSVEELPDPEEPMVIDESVEEIELPAETMKPVEEPTTDEILDYRRGENYLIN